ADSSKNNCSLLSFDSITILVALEYFFHFNEGIRTVLFFTFTGVSVGLVSWLIIVPVLQLVKIGKVINYEQAATIVGTHFSEIQDKLLNTLQLIRQNETGGKSPELLEASIDQKTKSLALFSFNVVINFRKNLKYLRYAVIPVVVILLFVVFAPGTISEPTKRIIRFNTPFIKPLPFKIVVVNKSLSALQQEDFELKVEVTGEEIPAEIYLKSRDFTYKLVKAHNFMFSYVFKSVQSDIPFKFIAGDFQSSEYVIKVFAKPIILSFDVDFSYPAYINKPSEKVENLGDLSIPEGTVVTWNFHTRDVSAIRFRLDSEHKNLVSGTNHTFSYSARIMKSCSYCVSPFNENTLHPDSLAFRINSVADGFPSVFIHESADSSMTENLFFKGTIKDDYGFSKLNFIYSVFSNEDSTIKDNRVVPLVFDRTLNNQVFYYAADLAKLLPGAGQNIRYYFEVWDNDGIHGPKATRSETRTLRTLTLKEISDNTASNENTINQEFEKSISDSKSMKKTMDELNKKLVDQSSVSWQEKKKLEDLIKAHEAIENKVEEIKKKNRDNIRNEENYLETSQRIIEKQKKIADLMDQLLSEEMKKMISEMKDLLNQIDKTKLADLLEKMKMSNKELETQLDRNLALMKQLEFDRKMEEMVKDLRKAADEQEKLANKTENNNGDNEKLMDEQKKIADKADSLGKRMEEMEKTAKNLENPPELGNTKQKQDSINKSLSESQKKLKEGKNKEASAAQKKTARQMRDLAQQMEDSQEENESDQLEEDAANIRMILENLVRLSFDQEEMINSTSIIARNDPRYNEIVLRQKEFGEKLKVVEDSLNAIARRQAMIKPVVAREVAAVNLNVKLALDALDNHNINMAVAKQQYSMTSINNLAVLLNESLEKMNEQMAKSQPGKAGSKQCKNPSGKGGKMSAKSMKEMQQKIGQQIEKLKAGLEGASKQGKGDKQGQNGMNREVAKLAAQQEALRNEMQKDRDDMGSNGLKDQGSLSEAAREMEQIEKDLINKNITQETFLRQQNILTRLLESEKAEQTREQEEKRESTEAKNQKISNPGLNYQYNMKKKASQDNIQLILPVLSSFYKGKVNSYIVKIAH
ncbi:MAG: DUF4175 family protein, partial [Bacteroidota bacterium]